MSDIRDLTVGEAVRLGVDVGNRAGRAMHLFDGVFKTDPDTGSLYADPPLSSTDVWFCKQVIGTKLTDVPDLIDFVWGPGTYRRAYSTVTSTARRSWR